jgi:hypothetical protein
MAPNRYQTRTSKEGKASNAQPEAPAPADEGHKTKRRRTQEEKDEEPYEPPTEETEKNGTTEETVGTVPESEVRQLANDSTNVLISLLMDSDEEDVVDVEDLFPEYDPSIKAKRSSTMAASPGRINNDSLPDFEPRDRCMVWYSMVCGMVVRYHTTIPPYSYVQYGANKPSSSPHLTSPLFTSSHRHHTLWAVLQSLLDSDTACGMVGAH